MASRKRKSPEELEGKLVAVGLGPHAGGNGLLSLYDNPGSTVEVVAQVHEVWLEDVHFFVPSGVEFAPGEDTVYVVGVVLAKRAGKVTEKRGWMRVRVDEVEGGGFYAPTTGVCVRSAKYARIRHRKLEAFGLRTGEPIRNRRDLVVRRTNPEVPTYGPRRESWRGEMGGQNFELASVPHTGAAIQWVLDNHPGCVIIDGTDDWEAPLYVRPSLLCERYGITPVAWWHTGRSGLVHSGAVLSPPQWGRMRRAFQLDFGFPPARCPGPLPSIQRGECGCWQGEGLRIYAP